MGDESRCPVDDVLQASGLATLGASPTGEALETALTSLAALASRESRVRRELIRELAVKAVKAGGSKAARSTSKGTWPASGAAHYGHAEIRALALRPNRFVPL